MYPLKYSHRDTLRSQSQKTGRLGRLDAVVFCSAVGGHYKVGACHSEPIRPSSTDHRFSISVFRQFYRHIFSFVSTTYRRAIVLFDSRLCKDRPVHVELACRPANMEMDNQRREFEEETQSVE